MMKSYIREQEDWDLSLGCLTAAYRATVQESTKLTPNMMMLGREVRLPMEVTHAVQPKLDEPLCYGEYVGNLRDKLHKAHTIARDNLKGATERQQGYYDAKATLNKYHPGHLVWYLNESTRPNECPKLQNTYIGPVPVIKVISDLDYIIQTDKKGSQRVFHHDKLKPYEGKHKPRWVLQSLKKLKQKQ